MPTTAFIDRIDPALVYPVVAFLAHEDCAAPAEIYTAGAEQASRFFIGRTRGHCNLALPVEDVQDQLAVIGDQTRYTAPAIPAEEIAQLFRTIAADSGIN